MDVIVTTWKNDQWIQRCLISLLRNTREDDLGTVRVMGPEPLNLGPVTGHPKTVKVPTPPEWSCTDKLVRQLTEIPGKSLVLLLQDDALIMPGNPDWLRTLAQPFALDQFVAVSSAVVTACGMPHMSIRMALPPGPYYSTAFMVICCVARVDAMLLALKAMPNDLFGDQEPALNLMQAGWKIVINTHVPVYHEGMQSNLRCFGGDDPKAWVEECRRKIREEIPQRHPEVWVRRTEAMEMVPMEQFYIQRGNDAEVRLT